MSNNNAISPRAARRLYDRLSLVANAVSLCGVKVHFNARKTSTDGRSIKIARLPMDSLDSALSLAMGYIIHESFHVLLTDFTTLDDENKLIQNGTYPPVLSDIANAIEDGFIEHHGMQELPGTRSHMNRLVARMIDINGFRELDQTSPEQLASMYVLYVVRHRWCANPGVDELLERGRPFMVALLGAANVDAIDAVLGHTPPNHSADCLDRACRVMDILMAACGARDSADTGDTGDTGDSGDSGEDDSDASDNTDAGSHGAGSDSEADAGQDGDNTDSATDEAASDANGDEAGEANSGDTGEAGTDAADQTGASDSRDQSDAARQTREQMVNGTEQSGNDMAQGVADVLNRMAANAGKDNVFEMPESAQAMGARFVRNRVVDTNIALDDGGVSNRMAASLRRILTSRARSRVSPARSGRQVHRRRLAGAPTGNLSVFRNRQVGTTPDASVTLMIDASISMFHDDRMQTAMGAGLALSRALDRMTGIDLNVSLYCTDDGMDRPVIMQVKSASETLTSAMPRFGIPNHNGYTPTGEALLAANEAAIRTQRSRRMVILLTDGESNGDVNPRHAFTQGRNMGIEYQCLGIKIDLDDSVYPNAATLHDVADLPDAILSRVSDLVAA